MRTTGNETVGDAGTEDAEAQQRQRREHDGHRIVDRRRGSTEAGGELGEERRADADDDGQHHDLDARRDDIAKHPFSHESGFAEQAERDQDETGECRKLELDQRHEELDGEHEKGEEHERPGEQHAGDLDEILEEGPVAHQVRDGFEQRVPGIEPGLRDLAGAQEIGDGEAGAGRLQAEASKALEDDAGKVVPVADDVGEDADEQRLLDQPSDDVVVGTPRPE